MEFSPENIVIGAIILIVIAGVIYLVADNRQHKRRMYEASLRGKKKATEQEEENISERA